jgi:hypothetical protein
MMVARRAMVAAVVLGWSSGCGWLDHVPVEDLGSTDDGLSAPPSSDPIPEKEFPEQIDPGFEGHWVGYVEDPFRTGTDGQPTRAVFPSGSTEVTLDYRFEGEFFTPVATLIFGAAPAPAPVRGEAYPAGVNHYFSFLSGFGSYPFEAPIVEGFEYPLTELDPRYSGSDPGNASLLRFVQLAAFAEWCAVQEGLPQGDGDFECLGAAGLSGGDPLLGDPCIVSHADGTEDEVDCNFASMCLSDLCACSAGGCVFGREQTLSEVFLERQGDQIIGTISGATLDSGRPGWYSPMGTLRLQRVSD